MAIDKTGARPLIVAVQACLLVAPGAWRWSPRAVAAEPARSAPAEAGAPGADDAARSPRECFFVIDHGSALLGADGVELERLDPVMNSWGALSRDGRWVAFGRSAPDRNPDGTRRSEFLIKSRVDPGDTATVPMNWGQTGSSVLPIWSPDSKRLLLCEQGWNGRERASSFRIYDVASRACSPVNLPQRWWPNDWSADGKRVLISLGSEKTIRIAWVNIDGTGEPEFVTSPDEVAYRGHLSPDNRRILCMMAARKADGTHGRERLTVVDLATKARTVVDRPGHTDSY
jgi:hypothetical protein